MVEQFFVYILGENLAPLLAGCIFVPCFFAIAFVFGKTLSDYFDKRNRRDK